MEEVDSSFINGVALVPNTTYNYSNSSVFYSLVSYQFQNYYKQVIKTCQEWLDGYVPSFHKANNGILSTRIAAKISRGVANQIFGRGLIYTPGRNTTSTKGIEFISHQWQDECDFQNVIKTLIGYTCPLGTSLLKINKSLDGKLWAEALRADYFYFSVDGRGKLQEVTTFIRSFQSTNNNKNYCLVERRFFKNEHPKFQQQFNDGTYEFENKQEVVRSPYVVYRVYEIDSTSNNNSLAANSGKGKDFKSLPDDVKHAINTDYSAVVIDKEIKLPFVDYLGCELFKNEGGDITHPSTPFGSPMMFDLISCFMEYDMEASYSIRDLYNSKGIVGIPKSLTQSQIVPGTAGNLTNTPFTQLNIPGYENVPGLNPETQKPVVTQFEMRAAEHEQKQNAILKTIATSIGMSPRVIASYLVNGNEKTAEQTHSEDDTITNWIKIHRQDYVPGLNRIIECVLSYNGIIDNVEVKFASDGLLNEERQIENIKARMEMGLLDLEGAVREYYSDLDEEQLKLKIAAAQKQQQMNQQQQMTQFDEQYGDGLDEQQDQFPGNEQEDQNEFNQ